MTCLYAKVNNPLERKYEQSGEIWANCWSCPGVDKVCHANYLRNVDQEIPG